MNPHQKGFAHLILIVVILVVGLGTGGYFIYQNLQTKRELPPQQEIPTPAPTDNPTTISPVDELTFEQDQMLDWKTYKSEEMSFSIKYPQDLSLNFEDSRPFFGYPVENGYQIYFNTEEGNNIHEAIARSKESIVRFGSLSEMTSLEEIEMSGYSGFTFYGSCVGYCQYIFVETPKENVFMAIDINFGSKDGIPASREIIDKILSTFEFAD